MQKIISLSLLVSSISLYAMYPEMQGMDLDPIQSTNQQYLSCPTPQADLDKVKNIIEQTQSIDEALEYLETLDSAVISKTVPVAGRLLREKFGGIINESVHIGMGTTRLNYAARTGKDKTVSLLLAAGADDKEGCGLSGSSLHQAVEFKHDGIVSTLLHAGANKDARNLRGETPLHIAAIHGNDEAVGQLIHAGADINAQDAQGITPLFLALSYIKSNNGSYPGEGNDPITLDTQSAELLLAAGADTNKKTSGGNTCLMEAISTGKIEIAMRLIPRSNVNEGNKYGDTPLGCALLHTKNKTLARTLIQKLLEAGADPNQPISGVRPLYNAYEYEKFKLLLDAGANPLLPAYLSDPQSTFLFQTIFSSNDDAQKIMKEFIARGVNVNQQNRKGNTALHSHVWSTRSDITIPLLVASGAVVNVMNNKGATPLVKAVKHGRVEAVIKLLVAGALHTVSYKGKSLVQIAQAQLERSQKELCKESISYKQKTKAFTTIIALLKR